MEGWQVRQGRRRRPVTKNFCDGKSKTKAARFDQSSSPASIGRYIDIQEDLLDEVKEAPGRFNHPGEKKSESYIPTVETEPLPHEIKAPDGKRVRIEYEFGGPVNVKDGIPWGPPSFETVEKEGSGVFYYRPIAPLDYPTWIFGWHKSPHYYPYYPSDSSIPPPKSGTDSRFFKIATDGCSPDDDDDDDEEEDEQEYTNVKF